MQIHERIKTERLKKKLSEDELAGILNIPRSTYQYWEIKTPNVDKIKSVAVALGLPENYFFVNDENPPATNDEIIGNKITSDITEHGTQVEGTVLKGQVVFVEAKDLTASYERIIEEKERIIKIIESQAEKAERDKERLYGIIEKYIIDIHSNSKETADHLAEFANEVRVEHRVMMDSIDKAAKQQIGTTRAKAGNAELIVKQEHSGKGKKAGMGKQD